MPLFTIPLTVTVEAATLTAAQQIATKAEQLLASPFTKGMITSQGIPLRSVKAGQPMPVPERR